MAVKSNLSPSLSRYKRDYSKEDEKIRCDRSETPSGHNVNTETLQMSKPIESVALTPSSLQETLSEN